MPDTSLVSYPTFEPVLWPQTIVEIDRMARIFGWQPHDILRLWSTHEYLSTLFSGRYRGSGRPFLNHLAGTAGLSLMLGGDLVDVLFCYAHAAFEQGEFGSIRPGPTPRNRQSLSVVIGEPSEALVFDYDKFDWIDSLRQVNNGIKPLFTEHERRILIARILNQLDDSLDSSAYNRVWFNNCVERLELGANFLDSINAVPAANLVRRRIKEMPVFEPIIDKGFRPKRSITIHNRAYARRSTLRFSRAFLNWIRRSRQELVKTLKRT